MLGYMIFFSFPAEKISPPRSKRNPAIQAGPWVSYLSTEAVCADLSKKAIWPRSAPLKQYHGAEYLHACRVE